MAWGQALVDLVYGHIGVPGVGAIGEGHDEFHVCAQSIALRTQHRACGRPADHVGFLTYVINGLPAQMERSAGSLGAIPYVNETPDCSTAGVNPTIRIESRPQLDLLEIAEDRKSVVEGKSVSVRLDLGGSRLSKNTKTDKQYITRYSR